MEDNVWWTRKSRINAEKRLLSNQHYLDLLLLWYSLSAVFVSIWQLYNQNSNNQLLTSTIFTCFSVFILALSLFNGNCRYSSRAAQFKDNYIALQSLYFNIKGSTHVSANNQQEYERLLNISENHEEIDHVRALIWEWHNAKDRSLLTQKPQPHHYIIYSIYLIKRTALLATLFILPIILASTSFIKDLF
ncbi:SLATT domain-containing protein [Marinobacter sp. PE14]